MGETRRWGSQQWQTGQICTNTLGLLGTYLGTVNDQSPFFKECGSHTLLIGPPWTLIPSGCYLPSPYNISPSPSTNFKEHCRNNPPPPPNLRKRKTNNTLMASTAQCPILKSCKVEASLLHEPQLNISLIVSTTTPIYASVPLSGLFYLPSIKNKKSVFIWITFN